MEQRLSAVATLFRPELRAATAKRRFAGMADVIAVLYGVPLALVGLVWLIRSTDLSAARAHWPTLLLLLLLQYLFSRLEFSFYFQIRKGLSANFSDSLGQIVSWSAVFIFGPAVLWLPLIVEWITALANWRDLSSPDPRWRSLRTMALSHATITLSGLAALSLYRRWGGAVPLPSLSPGAVLPGLGATLARHLVDVLIVSPFLVCLASSKYLTPAGRPSSVGGFIRFSAISVGWSLLVEPFAVLAAGLYGQSGLGGYLFFVAGVLLANLVAREMSRAVERSQQRSRELSMLEKLGRAMLDTPPGESALPQLLREHVPEMFPRCQMEVWAGTSLLLHPEDQPSIEEQVWPWLQEGSEARAFLPREALPWTEEPSGTTVVVCPISDVETGEAIGGVYLAEKGFGGGVEGALPAVQSLAAQIASSLHNTERYQQTLSHERVEQELILAGQIQASFLPSSLPQLAGWDLAATLRPARETSGDFYDVIPLPNGRFGIAVADVADKGMGAALYMSLSRTLIRTYAVEYHTRPDFVLRVANRRMLMDSRVGMFVTVFYGILDPITGTLIYCNAGHVPPHLWRAQNGVSPQRLVRTGMALGVSDEVDWEQTAVQISPGDMLLVYTDGVTDAEDETGAFFGEERLSHVGLATAGHSAQAVQDAVLQDVSQFIGAGSQLDDITLMAVARSPQLSDPWSG